MIHVDVQSDHPIGEWRVSATRLCWAMLLEIGIVVLSIACFVRSDLYVVGCERV